MKVMVAMSGGVDSSVAAAIVRDQGHEIVGVTMKLWGGPSDSGCCSVSDVDDARRVAQQLGIDHHVFNFGDEFDEHVVGPYLADHVAGRTPNPCVECNRHIKFDKLLRRADALGFDAVATGHHARKVVGPGGSPRIARGADRAKDQSYVLYPLMGRALARVELPLGEWTKDQVRSRAEQLGLRTAAKPDSQDVCFVTRESGRAAFLGDRIPLRPGTVVDTDGVELGSVDAVELVTIGQRKGLELSGGADRRYVIDVDTAARRVTVGARADLDADGVDLVDVVWADGEPGIAGPVTAQYGAHGAALASTVRPSGRTDARVEWTAPQRRVASGQSVVLYDGDQVVAGGIVA